MRGNVQDAAQFAQAPQVLQDGGGGLRVRSATGGGPSAEQGDKAGQGVKDAARAGRRRGRQTIGSHHCKLAMSASFRRVYSSFSGPVSLAARAIEARAAAIAPALSPILASRRA